MSPHPQLPSAERAAAARSRVYQLLASVFAFPDPDLHAAVADGTLALALLHAGRDLPYDLSSSATVALGAAPAEYVAFESEYIRLFDVGAAGPPCPLYGGVYAGDRMKTMEDATRFYNFFHLRVSPETRELPDHVTTELEFMHYLTFREAEVHGRGADPGSLLRAQRDFLQRHLRRWLPRMEQKLGKQSPLPFFGAIVQFAVRFVEADHAYVDAGAARLAA